jgi:hypothetical protein
MWTKLYKEKLVVFNLRQTEENTMKSICRTYGANDKCIPNYGPKTCQIELCVNVQRSTET